MALLFDLDGTLVDSREGIFSSFRYALAKLGRPEPLETELTAAIGPPLRHVIASLLSTTHDELISSGVAAYREQYDRVGVSGNCVHGGITSALDTLCASGVSMYVATSKALHYAERIVEHHGLAPFFRGVYGSELDGTRSSKQNLIAHLLRCERLTGAECMMIGDRSHDVLGARANGVTSVGVLWGFGSRLELQSCGADRILRTPTELSTLVVGTAPGR